MPESPRIPTVPEISQSAARSGRLAARTTVACAATDSGPACLRACVGEAVSWRSPVRTGLVQPRRAHRGYVGNSADSNGGKSQIAQPGRDARAITPAKRVSPKLSLGRSADPRRVAEARNRRFGTHGLALSARQAENAV